MFLLPSSVLEFLVAFSLVVAFVAVAFAFALVLFALAFEMIIEYERYPRTQFFLLLLQIAVEYSCQESLVIQSAMALVMWM